MSWPAKDPDDILDFGRDFTAEFPRLTIASAQVIVPAGVTLEGTSINGKTVYARLSGGVAGKTYSITFRLTFSDGQQADRSERLSVRER